MVDRARVVSKASTGTRVEGTTKVVPTTGPWFRARLTLPDEDEDVEAGRSRVRTVTRPELLYDLTDASGEAVDLTTEHRLEVDSAQLGRNVWEVSATKPIRKRRRVIGHTAQLALVKEHQATLP
jgi:hypothetical protein